MSSHDVPQDHEDIVTLEYQSFYDLDSSDVYTELQYTKGRTHDETSINDLCDSSTYNIAKEFHDDLECFIIDHNEDTVVETQPDFVSFEFLSHNLLYHHDHHLNFSMEDHQHLPNNFTSNEDSVYDPEDCQYVLETPDVILSEYEKLSKDFEFIIRSVIKNSDMVHTSTGAD